MNKITSLAVVVETALTYQFMLIVFGVPFWIFLLILMLCSRIKYGKDNDYYEMKHSIAPNRYLLTIWQITVDKVKDGNQDMKESWPIYLTITIIVFLPLTVSLIFGWC